MLIQMTKHLGIKTINLVRREEQIKEIKDLGGDYVLCTKNDIVPKIMEITGGKGIRYAVDPVGGEVTDMIGRCLGVHGHILVYGLLSDKTTCNFNCVDALFKNIKYEGFHVHFHLEGPKGPETMRAVTKLFEEGKLHAPVCKEYTLDNYHEALKTSTGTGRSGKILFNISQIDQA